MLEEKVSGSWVDYCLNNNVPSFRKVTINNYKIINHCKLSKYYSIQCPYLKLLHDGESIYSCTR
ncbi:hypothetical protein ACFL1H_03455 [Nanoarchaeota archaeon]